MKKSIGLIAGMGPLAGADVVQKIIAYSAKHYGAISDTEYPSICLLSRGIDGFGNLAKTDEHFKKELLASVRQLDKLSPTVVGIACNTAHLFFDELESQAQLVNLVEETAKAAGGQPGKYMLLTSSETKKTGLYLPNLQKAGVNFSQTDSYGQFTLDQIIGLVMAHKLTDAGRQMTALLYSVKNDGFDGVIAGCTELPIAITNAKSAFGLKIVSSNQVLAEALVDAYYNH